MTRPTSRRRRMVPDQIRAMRPYLNNRHQGHPPLRNDPVLRPVVVTKID